MPQNRILGYQAQARSKIVLNTVTIGALLILCSTLQVSLFGRFKIFGAVPDLMLCTVLCIAYFRGKYAGSITGIAAGVLIEAIGSQGISLLPVVYMVFGYVVGHYSRAIHPKRYTVYLIALACGLCLRAFVTVGYTCLTYELINLPQILLCAVLPEMSGTAIMGCALYYPVQLICKLLDKFK
ncbi:MAG: rod shape-determining protein MreD [Clostridia bacterium]|nr:rod shape-determining protein MreD [Clostridia bacterium]